MAAKCIPGDSYVEGILVSFENRELKIRLIYFVNDGLLRACFESPITYVRAFARLHRNCCIFRVGWMSRADKGCKIIRDTGG
jgi:hypothetical protein